MAVNNDRWSQLSMQQRADLIKLYISNGISDLKTIRDNYNEMSPIIDRVNTTNTSDGVKRLKDPNREVLHNDDGTVSTHSMSWATDENGKAVVYPTVQSTSEGLKRFPDNFEKGEFDALDRAIERRDTIQMSPAQADWFTKYYKPHYETFNSYGPGGRILDGDEDEQTLSGYSPFKMNSFGTAFLINDSKNDYRPTPELKPSNELLNFFEDYAWRYDTEHSSDKEDFILNRVKQDNPAVEDLPYGIDGKYNIHDDIIKLQDFLNESTYTHELSHKLRDYKNQHLNTSKKERDLLRQVYNTITGEWYPGEKDHERFATNTQLRSDISRANGDVLFSKLDSVIDNMSSEDILKFYDNVNGYTLPTDYYTYKHGIKNGKDLYNYVDGDYEGKIPYDQLSDTQKYIWDLKFKYGEYRDLLEIDEDKIKLLKQALKTVAQNTTDPNRLDYVNPDNIAANGGNINKFAPGGPLNEGIEEYNNTGHENNPLLYEQSYYDDTEIFPTLDLRDFNRRDVKNLAFTVAGRNNDHYGVTVDEVLNDKLNYNSKHSRQEERFKRLVGRQYKRNVRYTEQMERLKAAAQGDISAMQDYITKGTERVAPLGIPFVAGPAAIATAKAGSFALAADAIGKVLSKNAVRWPLEILGFGDFIYNNVFTDEGVKKTIKRAQEGDFWGTIGSGTVDLLDFVGVAGAGYDAMKLLDPNFKNLKRGYKYLTAQKRRLKALDLRNKTLNQSNELYDEIRDFKTDKIQNGGLKFPSLEASYTTEHVSIPAGQASTTTVPFTLPDGSIINLETKVGSKGDVEKWYPVMEDPQWMMYRRVASMNPYSLDFRYNGPSGKTMHIGMSDVPLQAGRNPLFSQYLSDAQRTMGESGVIGGSSVLYDKGYISGVPHDLEIITTKSRKDALIQRIGFDEASATTQPLALNSTSKVAGGKGGTKETDIQIIDEDAQGFAIGKLAHEIYRVMHPEEHAKYLSTKTIENFANPSATSAQMKLPKPGGGYYTANELLDEFNKSGAAVKKTLIDALSVGKLGNSYVGTKLMRPVGILSNTDSALQADILDAIHAIGKFNLGEDFKTVKQLYPNIDYSDVKRNEEFLDALGFDKSLATNPKAMENITEYYHLQLSGSQRVYTNPRSKSDVIKFAHTTKDWGGGHAAGGGGNSTIGTGAAFEYPYRSMSQYPLVKDGAKVKTPLDIMDAYDMRKSDVLLSDIADQDQIQKLKDMGLNITDSTRLGEIDHYLANTNDEAITEEVGNILNINGLFGGDYHAGNTEYFGRYSKNSVADSYRIVDRGNGPQIEYEMGRLLHKYKDMQNNYGVEPQEAIDFKDTIIKTLDDFISGKITDKEGFRFDKGDYDKIVELKKQLEAMESNMSSLQKRTDKLDKIMSDLWDIGDKVDDILSKSVLWGGVAGLGSLLGGVVHSQVKNQKEWDLINEYADDYDKTEEYKDSYYKKLEDAFRTKELDRFSFPYKQYREAYKEHHQNMLNYAKKKKANKYLTGGGLNNESSEYVPATFAGWVSKQFGADENKQAAIDIASAGLNMGSDSIPVVGNALGVGISILDAGYDITKFLLDPSWSNLSDVGTSVASIIPGLSIKEAKTLLKASNQTMKNAKAVGLGEAINNTVKTNKVGKHTRQYLMDLTKDVPIQLGRITMPDYLKIVGTVGNTVDTVEDIVIPSIELSK